MRKLATAAFSFAAGIFLAQYLLPHEWQLFAALILFALGFAAFFRKGNTRRRILLICWGLSAALAYNAAYISVIQLPAERLVGSEQRIIMTVTEYPAATEYGAKVTVRPEIDGLHGVKAVYYGDESLLDLYPGCTVEDDVELRSASRIRDDDITTFTSKGVFLLIYGRGEPTYLPGTAGSLRWLPQTCARVIREKIAELFSGDSAGFLQAILTGDKSGISGEAATDLSEAGLYHILAVSGMHCAYLLTLISVFTGIHRRRLRAFVAVPCLLFYMLLAGCSPSVVRACVMILFVISAPLFFRENDMPTSMSAALALILLHNPFAAASISLQLSFAAISGIIWAAPAIRRLFPEWKKERRFLKLLVYSLCTSLGVAVCTAPLSAYYFNILHLVSPLSNLLCLWAAGFVFSLGLLAVLGGYLWLPLGKVIGFGAGLLVRYVLLAAKWLSHLPHHALYFSNPYLIYWLLFAYVLFLLCYLLKPKTVRKYVVSALLCAAALVVTVWLGTLRYTYGQLNITVLDVGQGASAILSSDGHYALVDCGSRNSWYDAGQIAADALLSMGCDKLDYLMLTHYDSDHISGVGTLLARIPAEKLLLPDTVDDSGLRTVVEALAHRYHAETVYIRQQTDFPLGDAVIAAYPPLGEEGDNQLGLTCLCSAGDYDLLITGDMSSATESLLLDMWHLPDIEALVVGHHGAASSTSMKLLETVKPELALISAGDNSYGHPANQTIRRLLVCGAKICRTDMQGDIHITVN